MGFVLGTGPSQSILNSNIKTWSFYSAKAYRYAGSTLCGGRSCNLLKKQVPSMTVLLKMYNSNA